MTQNGNTSDIIQSRQHFAIYGTNELNYCKITERGILLASCECYKIGKYDVVQSNIHVALFFFAKSIFLYPCGDLDD